MWGKGCTLTSLTRDFSRGMPSPLPSALPGDALAPTTIATHHAGVLFAVGGAGLLGGIWRAPPLALAEFSTQLAELLVPHSLAGLRAMMGGGGGSSGDVHPGGGGGGGAVGGGRAGSSSGAMEALAEAARAQLLRALSLQLSLT